MASATEDTDWVLIDATTLDETCVHNNFAYTYAEIAARLTRDRPGKQRRGSGREDQPCCTAGAKSPDCRAITLVRRVGAAGALQSL